MTPLSIIQILPSLNEGGVERGTVDLALYLNEHKIINAIISSGGNLKKPQKKKITLLSHDTKSKNPLTFSKRVKALRKIIATQKPNVLHARSRIPAWLTHFANKPLNIPFVTTYHGLHDNGFMGLKKFYNAGLIKSDVVIAVSETVKKNLLENFPKIKNKIVVIHRGIDCDYFSPIIGSKNTTPKIVLPARITSWKGHIFLLKSFALLTHKHNITAQLHFVGKAKNNRYLKKLQRLIKTLQIENQVVFAGSSNDMKTVYANADLVVSSSIEPESFGRVAVEAMAMEKLVIATDIGGSKETIIHEKTGWLTPPNDTLAMADLLKKALTLAPEEKTMITKAARQHVIDNFSVEKMLNQTLEVYKTLHSSSFSL